MATTTITSSVQEAQIFDDYTDAKVSRPSVVNNARCRIECPLPSKPRPIANMKINFEETEGTSLRKSYGLPAGGLTDSADLTSYLENSTSGKVTKKHNELQGDFNEEDILFDDAAVGDSDSLINLVEAQWELEEIFSGSYTTLALSGSGEIASPFSSMVTEEFDLPQLGPSPDLVDDFKFASPPSRSHNPVPLNSDFAEERPMLAEHLPPHYANMHLLRLFGTTAASVYNNALSYNASYAPAGTFAPSALERREEHSLSRHKRGRSYSDSVLRKDDTSAGEFGDLTKGNSLVVVS